MISVNRALKSGRLMRAASGLSAQEFNHLAQSFGQEFQRVGWIRYAREVKRGKRERKPGGGRIGNLRSFADKLFLVLFYFKCYPTFDVLGLLFDLNRSNAHRNVQKLTSILEKTLGKKMSLPKRKVSTLEELFEIFPDVKDLFIDGTERPIQRPKDNEKQKENYSGKKKAHTRKNIVITDKNRRIGYLSPPEAGKKHDYGMFKELFPPPGGLFPESITLWLDLGFTGVEKDYPEATVRMPRKKPKGKELTDEEKAQNKVISGFRVLVEHAIGGAKRFRITSDKFRNKKDEFNDVAMLISCGLWNYHLKCS
ncbi:MAG TPA: IS5/IS1182 family transposase [Methanophagales archaeon]|nr:IS5/IS1182 family transposase [Methanophagales archaeon]